MNDSIPNENIVINGFSHEPFRADKQNGAHSGGACLYFKENLPLKRRIDLELLKETIVVEIRQENNKKLFFILSYRHPNCSYDETDNYFSTMNTILDLIENESPLGIILTGDFNARSSFFWEEDPDTSEGQRLCELGISHSLEELISEPTHIRDDGSQSCIDLIFTNVKHAFTHVEVLPHPVIQSKHMIVHGKLSFSVPCPPPYKRKIWDYEKANSTKIRNEISKIDWGKLFHNKSIDETELLFRNKFLNIISKNIPNKVVTCHDKDSPWITAKVKASIKKTTEPTVSGF